jgi:D-alanyl-D-alanine carboxypeptidase
LASASSTPINLDAAAPRATPGSSDPIRPVMVKTLNVKPGGSVRAASVVGLRFAGISPETPRTAAGDSARGADTAPKPRAHTGWIIQVGAYPDEGGARLQITHVKTKAAKLLADADGFMETTQKGGTTYYRARFAGLNKDQAEAACKFLKRNDVDCMAIKN